MGSIYSNRYLDGFVEILLTSFQCYVNMACLFSDQGLDGEATEPMIKELEEEREESQDPEIEFAIAGAVRECEGLEIILSMIQVCCFKLTLSWLSSSLTLPPEVD